jgi:hypothetical protein
MKSRLACPLLAASLLAWSAAAWAQDRSTDGRLSTQSERQTVSKPVNPTNPNAGPKKPKKRPVVLDFDTLPGGEWQRWDCGDPTSVASVANGILTIDSNSCDEFLLWHPDDVWHQFVSNSDGWVIEARLKVDPVTAFVPDWDRGPVQIWANDHTNLLIIGFATSQIGLVYPDNERVAMNTTDDFHVYRIESRLDRVKIFVDGVLRIDHTLTWSGGGSDVLDFGDGVGGTRSLSYWDYFLYDVTP